MADQDPKPEKIDAADAGGRGEVPEGAASKPQSGDTDASLPRPKPTLSDDPPPPPDIERPRQPYRPTKKVLLKPRRVRGGVKLASKEGEPIGNWIGQRFLRVVEDAASGEAMREGLEYGRSGQVRRIELEGGIITASVQGRRQRSYTTTIAIEPFPCDDREKVIGAMAEQARYAAKLLAGELPPNIEDIFAPLGMKLFPASGSEMAVSCDCKEEDKPWCKHVVCAASVLAEKMSDDAFLVFAMRGLPGDLLIDALRQKRAIAGLGSEIAPVHLSHIPGVSEIACEPLEDVAHRFWTEPAAPEEVDLQITPPQVSHALLRRLGPSPFTESRFRLVGLLATCYDLVSEHVIARHGSTDVPDDEPGEIGALGPGPDPDPDPAGDSDAN